MSRLYLKILVLNSTFKYLNGQILRTGAVLFFIVFYVFTQSVAEYDG